MIDSIVAAFVDVIPEHDDMMDGVLYVCIPCQVAVHKCACGCGEEVATSISPHGWTLIYNGESVSLYPSIGNFNFKCRSHYLIRNSKIIWINDEIFPYEYEYPEPSNKTEKNKRIFFKWFFKDKNHRL